MVLMMYGLEYALNANAVAIAEFGVAPYEDINSAAAAGTLHFE